MNPQPKDKDKVKPEVIPVTTYRKMKVKKEKTLPQLKRELDKVFNKYIRQRDTVDGKFKCISCGEWKPVSQMNAGHFFSAGHHSALRWVEKNVNGQCVRCNCFLSGNLIRYREGIISKWGIDTLQWLEVSSKNASKIDRFEVKLLIDKYKLLLK